MRALHRLLQGTGVGCVRARSLPEPECRPGDGGVAPSIGAGTDPRADTAAQRPPCGAGRAQGHATRQRQIMSASTEKKESKPSPANSSPPSPPPPPPPPPPYP